MNAWMNIWIIYDEMSITTIALVEISA